MEITLKNIPPGDEFSFGGLIFRKDYDNAHQTEDGDVFAQCSIPDQGKVLYILEAALVKKNEPDATKDQIRKLLSSDAVVDNVMAHMNFIVNDDMFNGCTLVAEIKDHTFNKIQLQVRLTSHDVNYFPNYHYKAPAFSVDRKLNIKPISPIKPILNPK